MAVFVACGLFCVFGVCFLLDLLVNSVVFGVYSCWYIILFIRFECFELL